MSARDDAFTQLEQDVKRGNALRRLMEDPETALVLAEIRSKVFERWETAKTTNERENLHSELKGVLAFAGRVKELIASGEYAQLEINKKANLGDGPLPRKG